MTYYPLHFTDNANSWRRIVMLAKLYWPGFKPGFITCAVFPFLAVLFSALIANFTGRPIDWLFQWPISVLLYLCPIMLTKRDYRDVSAQLPVTTVEKFGFLLLTFWIVVPSMVYLSAFFGECVSGWIFGSQIMELLHGYEHAALSIYKEYGFSGTSNFVLTVFSELAMIMVVLYYVVTAKKNRVLAAIVSLIALTLFFGVIAGIIGVLIGFYMGLSGAYTGIADEAVMSVTLRVAFWVVTASFVCYELIGVIYGVKLFKRLRNCGF